MKVVILAGGRGSRLGAETAALPKALVPVNGIPVIRRVMAIYARQGFRDFIIVGGHLCHELTAWAGRMSDADTKGWTVAVCDTGARTDTASRLARIAHRLSDDHFFLTWCDGLADVDLAAALAFHKAHGRTATVTAVHPPERFGILDLDGPRVTRFREKPIRHDQWVNGAFFVLRRDVLDGVARDGADWEKDVLTPLAAKGELMAWRHDGPWMCMDTAKDRAAMEAALRDGVFAIGDAS
jgi:glucose-1-phosphate cytidylyltransferase